MFARAQVIAGYRLEERIGEGGMGVVYRATHLALGRPVALKFIRSERAGDPALRARLAREAVMVASIDHPNVVPIYDAGETDGRLFLAMRWVDGPDLRTLVATHGPLPLGRAVRIVEQVAAGLDAAHANGLVHRDVKPANVLLSADDHVFLTDFGVTQHDSSSSGLTRTGQFMGTVDYAAPEQIRGERVGPSADVYALGGLLFWTLTGQVPFPRDSQVAKLWAHVSAEPPAVTDARPDLPAALDAVVRRALAKHPAARFPSARALAEDAARAAAEHASGSRSRPATSATSRPAPARRASAARPRDPRRRVASDRAPTTSTTEPAPIAVPASSSLVDDAPAAGSRPRRLPRRGIRRAGVLVAAALVALLAGLAGLRASGGEVGPREPDLVVPVTGDPLGVAVVPEQVVVAARSPGTVNALRAPGDAADVRARPTGRAPARVVADGDRLLVADPADGTVLALDARTLSLTAAPVRVGRDVFDVAVAAGVPWSSHPLRGEVRRIDLATGTSSAVPMAGGPRSLAAAGGWLWVARGEGGGVQRIDPRRGRLVGAPVPAGADPVALTPAGGELWVADGTADVVRRLDARTGAAVGRPLRVPAGPVALAAAGADVWVLCAEAQVTVRLDARGRRSGRAVAVSGEPSALAAGSAGVWATDAVGRRVVRVSE